MSNSKSTYLYDANNPEKSKSNGYDVYSNRNPSDTIPIKYTTLNDVKNTIKMLEKLYKSKKYTHKRISQVALIIKVRLEVIKKYKKTRYTKAKQVNERLNLATRYQQFLKQRTKKKTFAERSKMVFKI
jgi:hypothetical protein